MMTGTAGLSPQQVAQGCPEAAGFSIHFPMQHCNDKCLRILQFVEEECAALPSAAKAPYLLTGSTTYFSFIFYFILAFKFF